MDKKYKPNSSRRALFEQLWCCCNCSSQAGMGVKSTTHCPECAHSRCGACEKEYTELHLGQEGLPTGTLPISRRSERGPGVAEFQVNKSLPSQQAAKVESIQVRDTAIDTHLAASVSVPEAHISHDSEGSRRPKKRRTASTDDTAIKPSFACPFYKYHPKAYDVRLKEVSKKKYRSCIGPRIPIDEVRRLKDHLQSAHGPLYCDHCSKVFHNKRGIDILQHCESCVGPAIYVMEGISSTQWKAIVECVRDKGGLKGEAKERRGEASWYKIWDIVLPGKQRPDSPLNTITALSAAFLGESEALFSLFEQIIEQKAAKGMIPSNDKVHQVYLNALKEAYSTCINNAAIMTDLDSSKPQVDCQISWESDVVSYQSTSSVATNGFETQPNSQGNYTCVCGMSSSIDGSIKQNRQSQEENTFGDFISYEACDPYSLSPVPHQSPWSPSSVVDPRVTLLSPNVNSESGPSIKLLSNNDALNACQEMDMYPHEDDQVSSFQHTEPKYAACAPQWITLGSIWHMGHDSIGIPLGSDNDQDMTSELDPLFGS